MEHSFTQWKTGVKNWSLQAMQLNFSSLLSIRIPHCTAFTLSKSFSGTVPIFHIASKTQGSCLVAAAGGVSFGKLPARAAHSMVN
jgi:hypothetical protein